MKLNLKETVNLPVRRREAPPSKAA
jgi:hypothetical protein